MSAFHAGAVARLHSLKPIDGFGIILAQPPVEPSMAAVMGRDGLAAIVELERGVSWPDDDRLLRAILNRGGVAMLAFPDLKDAMACLLRLRLEGVL